MAGSASKSTNHEECESRLRKNVLAAERAYNIAAQARSSLVGELLNNENPECVIARRQAFDHEQHSLENYVRALRQYNDLIADGKVPDGDQ